MTAETEPPPRRKPTALIATGVAAVLAGAGVTFWLVRSPTPPPARVSVVGHLVLDDYVRYRKVGDLCSSTKAGYADIRAGAQVTVTDPAGTVVALAVLDQGVAVADPLLTDEFGGSICSFSFTATVPAGLGIYGFEVSHRGRVQIPEVDLGAVELRVGK